MGEDCIFLYLLRKREVFAGRKGSWKAKEWPAGTFRKGTETPYLPWPVGHRETHTAALSFCSGRDVCVHCQLSVTADSGGRELLRRTLRFGSGNVSFSQNASVVVNTKRLQLVGT